MVGGVLSRGNQGCEESTCIHLAGFNLSSLFDTYSTIEIACEDFNVSFIPHGRLGLKQCNVRSMCKHES